VGKERLDIEFALSVHLARCFSAKFRRTGYTYSFPWPMKHGPTGPFEYVYPVLDRAKKPPREYPWRYKVS